MLPPVRTCHRPSSLPHRLLPTCAQVGGVDRREVEPWTLSWRNRHGAGWAGRREGRSKNASEKRVRQPTQCRETVAAPTTAACVSRRRLLARGPERPGDLDAASPCSSLTDVSPGSRAAPRGPRPSGTHRGSLHPAPRGRPSPQVRCSVAPSQTRAVLSSSTPAVWRPRLWGSRLPSSSSPPCRRWGLRPAR